MRHDGAARRGAARDFTVCNITVACSRRLPLPHARTHIRTHTRPLEITTLYTRQASRRALYLTGNVYIPFALALVTSGSGGEVRLVNEAAIATASACRFRDKVASAGEQ